jgi:EmrB/QacA subfamily drug resistance transporter
MRFHTEEVRSEKAGDACEDTRGERVTDERAAAVAVSQRSYTRRQVLVIFGALLLGLLLAALDQTIVATALPTIAGELGGLEHLSWVVTAYLLTSTVSAPLYGKLGDLYGRKPLFQIAIIIFLVGSALSGLSQGMIELILFRAVQGLGAGGLIVGAQAIVGDVVSPRERGRYQGIFGAVFGASSVAGPLLGGFFVENLSWRWVFYINLPLGVLALIVTAVVLHLPTARVHRAVDYLGSVLLTGGVACLILLTSLGGTLYPWSSSEIIGLGIAGMVLLAAFVFAEQRAAEPVLPLSLFSNRVFGVASAISFVVGFALFGAVTFLPLFLQVVGGASPTGSGLELVPMTFGVILTSIASGHIISRWGRYKVFPIVGTALMTIGLFLLSRMDENTGILTRSIYILVLGLGLGMVMQVLVLVVQNAVDYRNLGTATSAATFFRSIGGCFGVAVFGAIFNSQLAENLPRYLPSGAISASVGAGAVQSDPLQLQQLSIPVREGYLQAFAASMDTVFLAAVPFALVAFILAWFLPELPLRKTVETTGLGESFAMPKEDSSLKEIERSIRVLVSREGQRRIYERLAARAGVDLGPAECWLLFRIEEYAPDSATSLASRLELSQTSLLPHLERLEEAGLLVGDEDSYASLALSPNGQEVIGRLVAARRQALGELLEGWSPEQHEELARMLGRLARELLQDDPQPGSVGTRVGQHD